MPIFKAHFSFVMIPKVVLRTTVFFISFFYTHFSYAQPSYQFSLTTEKEVCLKASAYLEIAGTDPTETLSVVWSNGVTNANKVYELSGGDYNVHVNIIHQQDSLMLIKDTTLYFTVGKELCEVSIDKYFSPNDDNYHDRMGVNNADFHPNFELNIFNKWGQRVHVQKHTYTPWDGKWNGIDLPDGTYFYVFFYNESEKTNLVKGDVTILR